MSINFKNGLNKSFGFQRLRGEPHAEGNQMDPMCQGLIPGLPFRRDSWTVSEGPGLEAVALRLCPREVLYMHLVTGDVE